MIEANAIQGSLKVRLEGCTFNNNTPSTLPTLLADNKEAKEGREAVYYSEFPSPSVCTCEGEDRFATQPPCVDSSPLALGEAGSKFLTTTDTFGFVKLQQVRVCEITAGAGW